MKVVFFIHNHSESGAAYSGGRYHALLQAGALAQAGAQVTVVVDSMPTAARDLAAAENGGIDYLISPDYAVTGLAADVVVVSPTGAFHPTFYEAAIRITRAAAALPVLINFESANWFNTAAPVPDDPRVWDYWRRIVADGGAVLSSTKLSSSYAQSYYHSNRGRLEFIQSYPPVNTEEILCCPVPRSNPRPQLLYFARPFTSHKGADDILAMPDAVFAGADLHVISGGPATEPFYAELAARVDRAPAASVTVHSQVSERFKFSLLLATDVLLFPSRFEGYGYPPLEAAYCGADVVAYRLPVLAETVAAVASLVPAGDRDAFAAAVVSARERPRRRQLQRAAIGPLVEYGRAGQQLIAELANLLAGETLTGAGGAVDRYSVHWAPFTATADIPPRRDDPPVPPVASVTEDAASGGLRLALTLWARTPPGLASLSAPGAQIRDSGVVASSRLGPWRSYLIFFNVPDSMLDATFALRTADAAGAAIGEPEELRIVRNPELSALMTEAHMENSKVWRPAIEFNLTEHCNLSCEHCDHASGIMPAKLADLGSFVNDIEALSSVLHAAEFKFLGGEPLLHPELLDFLRAAREIGIADRLVLLTNGVLLHKAPDELWDLIDGMWISVYPGIRLRFDWDWIQEIADQHNIFVWRNDMPNFAERLLTEKIENDAFVRMIYENCDMAHLFSCHTVHEGRYYACSPSVWMEPRLRLHGIDFENRQDDSVAIHDNADLHADLERLIRRREPLKACQYCLGSWAHRVPNQQLTRKGARESLQRKPKKLSDLVNSSEWIVPRSYIQ